MGIKTNKEKLFSLYKKTIKQPLFEDLVLVVLGGEKGVIAEYFEKNIKFSKLIVVEPITALGNDPQTKNNYKNFNFRNKGKILHFTLKEIEEKPNDFIDLLLENKIVEKGMEVIRNPFYEKHYSKEIVKVHEQIDRIVENIRSVITMKVDSKDFTALQKKYDLENTDNRFEKETREEISKVESGELVVLIGFGNGDLCRELIKNKNVFNIALVEPYNMSLNEKQKNILKDLKELTKSSYDFFEFENGDNEFLRFFDFLSRFSMFMNEIKILINPIYLSDHFETTLKTVKKVKEMAVEVGTLKGNSNADDIYGIMNIMYNLRNIDQLKTFPKDLTFKNVIAVAAGPSLDDHMEELKTLSKKFIVIAVEVVANKLIKNGIFPDIICSQERILEVYSEYTRNFLQEAKEKSVFVAPALLHTYSLEEMKNTVLLPQALRSSYQRYMFDNYYDFTDILQTSIHAGLLAINVAYLFKPKNIIIFGHDVSVPTNKQSHAVDITGGDDYYREDAEIATGNRGQQIYLPQLLKQFFNNTELMTLKAKQEMDIHFYNFSDGAKITAFEESNETIYNALLEEENDEKELYKKLVSTKPELKEKIMKQLSLEKETLKKQIRFLYDLNDLTKFTKNARFLTEIAEKESILAKALRLLLDDYYSNHAIFKNDIEKWIAENDEEILSTAEFMLEIVDNTINLINEKEQLPLFNSENLEKLYKFKFYAVIRKKFLDAEDKPIKELSENEFTFLLESFLHTFQPLNYIHFYNLLILFKSEYPLTNSNKELYYRGISRCIDFFETKRKEFKHGGNESAQIFIREHLTSLLYEGGYYEELISLINTQDDPTLFELDLLADTYNEIGQYESSFIIYKELLTNKIQNKKIFLNLFNNLIFMGKYAESLYLSNIINEKYKSEPVYQANFNYLQEQITQFKQERELFNLELSENELSDVSYIKITEQLNFDNADVIFELLGKQQNIQFTKFEDRYYFDHEPDITFFIEAIQIYKL